MIQAEQFIAQCRARGFSFFTGVPCSFLKPLINYVIQDQTVDYVAASSEGESLAIAAGASLAGTGAVVMCQNSGLGNLVNPLTSLTYPFQIPILLIVTLRGEAGLNDEPQHELMGRITGELLDTMCIPWTFFPRKENRIQAVLDTAQDAMRASRQPYALVMRKGDVAKIDMADQSAGHLTPGRVFSSEMAAPDKPDRISRSDAIRTAVAQLSRSDAIIATTGKIGRELYTLGDHPNQLYVVGSMGCAAGLGFGIQHRLPGQRVLVLDGDGAALMKMGTLATIGHYAPPRFVHLILDNETYESTGGQSSVSATVDFCRVAAACGYRECFRVDTEEELKQTVISAKGRTGPTLIHVKVAAGSAPDLGRPSLKPHQVKRRFMEYLEEAANHG